MFTDKEVYAGQEHTPARDKMNPKKPKLRQNTVQQEKGGATKKGTQAGKKSNTQAPQEHEKETEKT
jgi:hypothetical protein